MTDLSKKKLSDAFRRTFPAAAGKRRRGKPTATQASEAEQIRETQESEQAAAAEASIRARMVAIGRGNQQAGRQGS